MALQIEAQFGAQVFDKLFRNDLDIVVQISKTFADTPLRVKAL